MVTRQNDLQSVTAFLERAMEREKAKHLLGNQSPSGEASSLPLIR